ncbi:MAG: large repetitive protein [Candidatus Sumerlaeota bacterium]|nr:large repetitive protein [Candidatus Sumerlaeota bacterium]
MRSLKRQAVLSFSALALAAAGTVSAATYTVDDDAPADFASIEAAIADASVVDGDTLSVAPGTYVHTGTLTISKSLTIVGAGQEQTILQSSGAPGTYSFCVSIAAPDVTLESLQIAGWTAAGTSGSGYFVDAPQVRTTFRDVRFHGTENRSVIVGNTTNDEMLIEGCRFTGEFVRAAIREEFKRLTVRNNSFEEMHYWYGPLQIKGTDVEADISYNYFLNGYGGFPVYGEFKETGQEAYSIQLWTDDLAGTGVQVYHNTFVFPSAGALNGSNNVPQPAGVFFDPGLSSYPANSLLVQDNIFQGYKYVQPAGGGPVFVPAGGVFGGAAELDGANDLFFFNGDAGFDVGSTGTMSVWVKLDDTGKRNQIFEGPGNGGMEMQYRTNSGGQFYASPNGSLGDYAIQSGGAAATAANWTNLQYTWDVTAQTMRVYVNGTEVTYLNATYDENFPGWNAGNVVDTTFGLHSIGSDPGDISRSLDGMMDDMAFWDTVLTPTQLDDVRTNGVAASAAPAPVAFWAFDEASGSTVVDGSGNGFDLVGGEFGVSTFNASGVIAPAGTTISNNLYFDNDADSSPAGDASNISGQDPLFLGTGSTSEELYALQLGSPAMGTASDSTNIGASQVGPPALTTNAGLAVLRGGSAFITQSALEATDNEDAAADITFDVTSGPASGTLTMTTFTQADINNGLVSYQHDGSTTTTDSFDFTVSDPIYAAAISETFAITVIPPGPDTDLDGLPDAYEISIGTLVNNRHSDADAFEDGVEVAIGTDPLVADTLTDADNDGLPDFADPDDTKADTDGDQYADFFEVAFGTNANDSASHPDFGDADGDDSLGFADGLLVLKVFLSLEPPSALQNTADVNRDQQVDNVDGVILVNLFLGNVPFLPLQ